MVRLVGPAMELAVGGFILAFTFGESAAVVALITSIGALIPVVLTRRDSLRRDRAEQEAKDRENDREDKTTDLDILREIIVQLRLDLAACRQRCAELEGRAG